MHGSPCRDPSRMQTAERDPVHDAQIDVADPRHPVRYVSFVPPGLHDAESGGDAMSHVLTRQFALFVVAGGVATAAHYALLIVLVEWLGIAPVPASMAGYVLGALVNYRLNYVYTFQSRKRHREALAKFLVVAGIGFVLNAAILHAAIGPLGVHYLPGQVFATVVVLFWNFAANKLWTFRENAGARR